ncbi:hypothetical protein [Methylobacterium haplocladii]|uniref:hypothetical protein n=1 Tax=Methylobacterium haplocladii TaxID=1176176 RepID=UPI0011BE3EE7|nr:hypothetical protein [Methylobacterium haplocladii]
MKGKVGTCTTITRKSETFCYATLEFLAWILEKNMVLKGFQITSEWLTEAKRLLDESPSSENAYVKPSVGSASALIFFRNLEKYNRIPILFVSVCAFADNAAHVAKSIQGHLSDPAIPIKKNEDPFRVNPEATNLFGKELRKVSAPLLEMVFSRLVDNLSSYLSSVTRECLVSKHEILRSKETITFELALNCDSMEELRELIVDRKIDELAYLGFGKLSDWISERLGIDSPRRLPFYNHLVESVEIRNCIIHNGSRIGHKYLRTMPSALQVQLNDHIDVDIDMIYCFSRAAAEYVCCLEAGLIEKFALPTSSTS